MARQYNDPNIERRLALTERGLDQRDTQANDRLTMEQERLLFDKAKQIESLAIARYKLETDRRQAISSAMAIEKLGQTDPLNPNYPRLRAEVLSKFPDALGNDLVKAVVEKQDGLHQSWQGAQQNLNLEREKASLKATEDRAKENSPKNASDMTKDMGDLLGKMKKQFEDKGQPVPQHVNDAIYNLGEVLKNQSFALMQKTTGAPATTPTSATPSPTPTVAPSAALVPTAVPPATPSPSAVPSVPTPAASPTPNTAPIDFLRKALGTSPTPTAPAVSKPVAAASSGLPDSSEAALTPDDEEAA